MERFAVRSVASVFVISILLLLASCGGGGSNPGPEPQPQNVQVSVQPGTAEVMTSGRLMLRVTVSGTQNTAVRFSVEEPNGGSVKPSGEYQAPAATGVYHVVVTSEADTSKTARATINVRPYNNRFQASASMLPEARSHHRSAVLADDSIVFIGGTSSVVHRYLPDADRFDAVNATLSARRMTHSLTSLPDGRVLVLGGETSLSAFESAITNVPDVYEPLVGPFTTLPSRMVEGRSSHTATQLANGNIVIIGGRKTVGNTAVATDTSETYDRATRTFTAGPSMPGVRFNHSATLLPNGKILVAGGQVDCTVDICARLSSALLYDPATQTFTPTGSLNEVRGGHTATLLPNGKVLIAGGLKPGANPFFADEVGTFEIYDPATGTFTSAGNMRIARWMHTATLLNDGRVLIAGGSVYFPTPTERTEIFDPATGTSIEGPTMSTPRMFHTANLLPNGKVLIVGGVPDGAEPLRSAELFD